MALVRIYLITFHRAHLLPRAIESIQRQTFTGWLCEVQNGDPADDAPGRIVAGLKDPRFSLFSPPAKIGPVEAFNLAHKTAAEPFQTLLEDDNWWEPNFLEEMLSVLARHPEAELAWSNMRMWREEADGGWTDTKRLVWNLRPEDGDRVYSWPQLIQISDMIYSNGSALLRSGSARSLIMPDSISRDMIEQARERLMNFPIVLAAAPLANFAVTRSTMRSSDFSGWGEAQALLAASFIAQVPMSKAAQEKLWHSRRSMVPRSTSSLIYGALLARSWSFLGNMTLGDFVGFVAGALKRPSVAFQILRAKSRRRETWDWLCEATRRCMITARKRGFEIVTEDSLLDKQAPGACGSVRGATS